MNEIEYLRSKVHNIEWDGIDYNDYPDFCDAFILSAKIDDRNCTSDELDLLNDDTEFLYEELIKHLY